MAGGRPGVRGERGAQPPFGGPALGHAAAVPIGSGSDPAHRRQAALAAHVHRGSLPGDEVDVADGIPTTSPTRTLLDLAPMLSRGRLASAFNEIEVTTTDEQALSA